MIWRHRFVTRSNSLFFEFPSPALFRPAFADEVPLTSKDYVRLIGEWEGKYLSKSPSDDKVRFESPLRLAVVEGGLGTFETAANNRIWETTVKIKGGILILQIDRNEREFTYSRKGESEMLSAEYESIFKGYPRKNNVVLTKR